MVAVRVHRDDVSAAVDALHTHGIVLVDVDLAPPASGPEAELTVRGVSEDGARLLLEHHGVDVLASRWRP